MNRLSGYELVVGCPHCQHEMLISGTETLLSNTEHVNLTAEEGAYRLEWGLTCADCGGHTVGSVHILSRAARPARESAWPGSSGRGNAGVLPIASDVPEDRPEPSRTRGDGSSLPWAA